jgi:hypothetical protein
MFMRNEHPEEGGKWKGKGKVGRADVRLKGGEGEKKKGIGELELWKGWKIKANGSNDFKA